MPWSPGCLHGDGPFLADAFPSRLANSAEFPAWNCFRKPALRAAFITPEYYLLAAHDAWHADGFFVLTNAPFAAFGNYFLPIQIGAEDMAFRASI